MNTDRLVIVDGVRTPFCKAGTELAALGAEAARQPGAIRAAFDAAFAAQLDVLAEAVPGATEAERRQAALRLYSQLVGAIVLARIAAEPSLSLDILNASRTALGLPALPDPPDGPAAPSGA